MLFFGYDQPIENDKKKPPSVVRFVAEKLWFEMR